MREIKFKVVWNGEVSNEAFTIGEFTEGVEMSFKDGGTLPFKDIDWLTDKVEYLQFTGLHDKNGKEIYEGDIIKTNDETVGKIVFDRGCFRFMEYAGKKYENCWNVDGDTLFVTHPVIPLDLRNELSEVIGNIYEHGELLKNGQ